MVVRRILAGALLAPLLVLSACGGDDTSVADPPVAPTSPSTSAAHPPHRESAKAFIRRWAKAEQDMENTGETAEYAKLTPGCTACQTLIKQVKKFYAAGGYIKWQGLQVLNVERQGSTNGSTSYAITTNSTPTTYRESADGPTRTLKGGVTKELVSLKWVDGEYVVTSRARLSS